MTRLAIFLFIFAVFASPPQHNIPPHSRLALAPLLEERHPYGTVNNSYIVVFKDDVPLHLIQSHMNFVQDAEAKDTLVDELAGVRHVYQGPLNGYAGSFTPNVINKIRTLPEVAYIEKDQIVHTTKHETQRDATWVSRLFSLLRSL
jgi:cerevisin